MPEIALNPPPFNPQGEKGECGRPEAHHERRNAGASQGLFFIQCVRAGTPAPHSNGCAHLRRAYQQRLLQVRAPPARMRAGTPAHPGLDAIAPPGLPGAQRGLIVFIQPAQAGFALASRGLQPHGWHGIADLFLNLHQPAISACGRGRPHPIQVHGCARLRRAYQQRLLQVRAPPARMRAGRPRTQDSTPLPRRGFQALSEGLWSFLARAGGLRLG